MALSLDFVSIAISELANISERRVYKLVDGQRALPDYLTPLPGLNSGFMIPQYTAASIVSQNKQLCTPASVDSISSSKGQEDHVSMAANAATKTFRVVNNVYKVLAIELMSAAQALEFRRDHKSSPKIEEIYRSYRKHVSALENDRLLHDDMEASKLFLLENIF
jgi:histidine ammonia-lyase